MHKYLKKILILFYIVHFLFSPLLINFAYAKEDDSDWYKLWDRTEDTFLKELDEDKNPKYCSKKQKIIDGGVEKKYDYNLIYTDMQECLCVALENNFNIKINKQNKEMNKWEYRAKLSEFLPNIYASFMIADIQGTYLVGDILPRRIHEVPIQINYGILWNFNKGRTVFETRQRNDLFKASGHKLDFTKEQIILNTMLSYYELLRLKLQLEILKINLVETQEQLRYTKTLYELGLGTKYDLLRAEVEVANANRDLVINLNSLRLKQANLANIMGIDVTLSVYPSELFIDTVTLVDENIDVKTLYNYSISLREDVKEKEFGIKALEEERKTVYTDFIPDLTLQFDRGQVGTARLGLRQNDTLYLKTEWQLGRNLGFNSYSKLRSYDAKIKSAKYELETLKRNIKENIVSSYYTSQANLDKIKYAKIAVKAADEGLKNALARYTIGEATFLDVLNSQKIKTQARSDLILAIIDYNKAQAQLLFDSGLINEYSALVNYIVPPKDCYFNMDEQETIEKQS